MLRIAVPNKGTLAAPAAEMLREAGYRQRIDDRDLICRDPDNDVEFIYLRPRDIATYVGSGDLDLGITGRDLLVDAGAGAEEVLDLGFGGATFRFAARPETLSNVAQLAGRRIATAYPGVVSQLLRRLQGVLVARRYVMLAYDVRAEQVESACALSPGIESPTISPLRKEGWVAVQAMVARAEVHRIMDELYDLGARAILVTDIHACRL